MPAAFQHFMKILACRLNGVVALKVADIFLSCTAGIAHFACPLTAIETSNEQKLYMHITGCIALERSRTSRLCVFRTPRRCWQS